MAQSQIDGHFQSRVAEKRAALLKDVSRRKIPITGVSEFPLLEEIAAPVADVSRPAPGNGVDPVGAATLIPDFAAAPGDDTMADALNWMSVAAPFEDLRDRAEAHLEATGARPAIFLATLGPLAEHTARVDFARNVFAAGGIEAKAAPIPPESPSERAAAFQASGCKIAVLCGADKRYADEAEAAAKAPEGCRRDCHLARWQTRSHRVDRQIFMGADLVHELTVALAELGVK